MHGGICPPFQGKPWNGIEEPLNPVVGFWNNGLENIKILGILIVVILGVKTLEPKGEDNATLIDWVSEYKKGKLICMGAGTRKRSVRVYNSKISTKICLTWPWTTIIARCFSGHVNPTLFSCSLDPHKTLRYSCIEAH